MKKLLLVIETWADGSIHVKSPGGYYATQVDETGIINACYQIAGLAYPHEEGEIELVQE